MSTVLAIIVSLLLMMTSYGTDESSLLLYPLPYILYPLLYILHQLAHGNDIYYAQTHLKCSNSLQTFHCWMARMNLFFVLLYFIWCRQIPNSIYNTDTVCRYGSSQQ